MVRGSGLCHPGQDQHRVPVSWLNHLAVNLWTKALVAVPGVVHSCRRVLVPAELSCQGLSFDYTFPVLSKDFSITCLMQREVCSHLLSSQ